MNRLWVPALSLCLLLFPVANWAAQNTRSHAPPLQCTAFSPYVDHLNPDYGPQPSPELINTLLDTLVAETPFRCIMTYGVLNGLEAIFPAAEARNLKVVAIVWLDKDIALNSQSIAAGIQLAKQYPNTIIKMSCGSEVRTRHGYKYDGEILRCINSLREAGVQQPLTTIDTWWEWCNRSTHCQKNLFSKKVDWIGTNIFPWWENRHADLYTCTPANKAADFHIARMRDLRKANPGKEVMLTEFGWPNGPEGETEYNHKTQQHCGVANPQNQELVVRTTFKKLAEKGWPGTVFQAFSERWKATHEGRFGSYWGICQGEAPYHCSQDLLPNSP